MPKWLEYVYVAMCLFFWGARLGGAGLGGARAGGVGGMGGGEVPLFVREDR